MRRIETYVGQQVYEWSFSAQAQYTMTAIAKVCSAMFGVTGTVNGLACTPTGPASMAVLIGAGELYQVAPLEATACGTLPQNTANTILKQGIQLGTYQTSTFATPGTSGQSINYLIEAQYQDTDISLDPTSGATPVVLQFYNSSNPASPWSGPNGGGATSNTFRDGVIAYQIKAGVAATTGSQVTPSPDTGWIGLWVVTVPFGASSLTSSNISQYAAAPILPTGMLQSIITGNLAYGVDNGSANVLQATFPLPVTTLTDNMDVWVKVKAANTGATTFTPNPGVVSASPVVGAAHAALQGGELVANGRANLIWRQDITSWVLVECTGAAIQVAPATASQHAVQFGQLTGAIGSRTNLKGSCVSGATSITLTADQIIVGSALNGLQYALPSFNKTLNLATTGAGGMDTGTATASSWLAIYAIYNPTTGASALLGQIFALTGVQPTIYGGANMPSGYTASALLAVVNTTGTVGQLGPYNINGRRMSRGTTLMFNTSTATATPTTIGMSGAVPYAAMRCRGYIVITSTSTSNIGIALSSDTTGIGTQNISVSGALSQTGNYEVDLQAAQTIYYTSNNSAGTPAYSVYVSSFEI